MKNLKNKHVLRSATLAISLTLLITGLAWSPSYSWRSPWEADCTYRVEGMPFDLVWYAGKRHTLTVMFHDGSVYEYYRVPTKVFRKLMSTTHKGTFFNVEIRPTYNYCQLR